MKHSFLFAVAVVIALAGCKKDPQVEPVFRPSTITLTLYSGGEQMEFPAYRDNESRYNGQIKCKAVCKGLGDPGWDWTFSIDAAVDVGQARTYSASSAESINVYADCKQYFDLVDDEAGIFRSSNKEPGYTEGFGFRVVPESSGKVTIYSKGKMKYPTTDGTLYDNWELDSIRWNISY